MAEPADRIEEETGGLAGYQERRRLRQERLAQEEAARMAKLRQPNPKRSDARPVDGGAAPKQ
jgi:hypothetical protein